MAAGEEGLPANEWILIVDDEFDIISIFKQALKKKGFHVFGFTDPLLALEHFQINAKRYGMVAHMFMLPIPILMILRQAQTEDRNSILSDPI